MVSFVACDKDDDEKSLTEQNKEKLIGNWKFVSSSTNGVQDDNGPCEALQRCLLLVIRLMELIIGAKIVLKAKITLIIIL